MTSSMPNISLPLSVRVRVPVEAFSPLSMASMYAAQGHQTGNGGNGTPQQAAFVVFAYTCAFCVCFCVCVRVCVCVCVCMCVCVVVS